MGHLRLIAVFIALFACLTPTHSQRYVKHFQVGDSMLKCGRHVEALAAYERSFKLKETSKAAFGIGECLSHLDPGKDSIWYRQALTLAKHEYVQARQVLEKIACMYRIAFAYQRLGEHEQALTWFRKDLCKGREVYKEIGSTLMALGRYDEALEALHRYNHFFPGKGTPLNGKRPGNCLP